MEGLLPGALSKLTKGRLGGKSKSDSEPSRSVGGFGPEHGMMKSAARALHIPGFKKGGKVEKTGAYKLHKGEKVLTAAQAKSHPCLDK